MNLDVTEKRKVVDFSSIYKELSVKGYVLIKNYFSTFEACILQKLAIRLQEYPEQVGGPMKYFESSVGGDILLNRVENFLDYYPGCTKRLLNKKLYPLFYSIFQKDYILFKDKINFKLPGSGGFRVHQDAPAFKTFIPNEMFTVMIPSQETNVLNGCLEVSDNYFLREYLPHVNGKIPSCRLSKIKWKHLIMSERDLLIFSSFLIHRSQPNQSHQARKCFLLTFNQLDNGDLRKKYFNYKRKSFPPRVERGHDIDVLGWNKNLAREIF